MQTSPNQHANLRPWRPGESGNPGGRPKGVTYPTEWMRGMAGLTSTEIQQIRVDEDEPVSRRIAAGMYLDALQAQTPRARKEAVAEICDRTSGKPRQQIEVQTRTRKSAKEIIAQIKRKYRIDERPVAKLPVLESEPHPGTDDTPAVAPQDEGVPTHIDGDLA